MVLARVEAELASVRIRPGMANILARVRDSGLPVALCSNLADPYGPAARALMLHFTNKFRKLAQAVQ